MEGYVNIQHKKKFGRYWAILENAQLSYYVKLDTFKQEPCNIQGVINVKGASFDTLPVEGRLHCINIRGAGKKSIISLDCEDNVGLTNWLKALEKAAVYEDEMMKKKEKIAHTKNLLKIDPNVELTQSLITKAYRKICLTAHPDKGGDVHKFSEIHQAYTFLSAYQTEEDEKRNSTEIEYEVVIQKKGDGVGIGIVVLEDPMTKRVTVKSLHDEINIIGISEEADGEIRPGDILVGIEKDDSSNWPLSRVRQRLNNFRVPLESSVRLILRRRVPNPPESEETPLSPGLSEFDSPQHQGKRDDFLSPVDSGIVTPAESSEQVTPQATPKSKIKKKFSTEINSDEYGSHSYSAPATMQSGTQSSRFENSLQSSRSESMNDSKDETSIEFESRIYKESEEPAKPFNFNKKGVNNQSFNLYRNWNSVIDSVKEISPIKQHEHEDEYKEEINEEKSPAVVNESPHLKSTSTEEQVEKPAVSNPNSVPNSRTSSQDFTFDVDSFDGGDIAEIPALVPQSDYTEALQQIEILKTELQQSQMREKNISHINSELQSEVSRLQSELRVSRQNTKSLTSQLEECRLELSILQERCEALTSVFEEKYSEQKQNIDANGGKESNKLISEVRLSELMQKLDTAFALKHENKLATNQLNRMKILMKDPAGQVKAPRVHEDGAAEDPVTMANRIEQELLNLLTL